MCKLRGYVGAWLCPCTLAVGAVAYLLALLYRDSTQDSVHLTQHPISVSVPSCWYERLDDVDLFG